MAGGPVAQLVERLLCKQDVVGSNPFGSTKELKKGAPVGGAFFVFIGLPEDLNVHYDKSYETYH